ncbi:MAG: hypothetical protein R3Y13_01925 [bacterium]
MNLIDKISNIRGINYDETIASTIKNFKTDDVDRMCRVYSRNLCVELKSKGINAKVVNLYNMVDYDHEVIIARTNEGFFEKYYLIDITFDQFLQNIDTYDCSYMMQDFKEKKFRIIDEEFKKEYFTFLKEDYVDMATEDIYNISTENISVKML